LRPDSAGRSTDTVLEYRPKPRVAIRSSYFPLRRISRARMVVRTRPYPSTRFVVEAAACDFWEECPRCLTPWTACDDHAHSIVALQMFGSVLSTHHPRAPCSLSDPQRPPEPPQVD